MMPTITYHGGYWWEEIAIRKTKKAAQRIFNHFDNAPQPHRVAMSRFLCPDCSKCEYVVWVELMPMDVKTYGVPHFIN